jgi:hypothetical protein
VSRDGSRRTLSRDDRLTDHFGWNSGDQPFRQTCLLSALPAIGTSSRIAGSQSSGVWRLVDGEFTNRKRC